MEKKPLYTIGHGNRKPEDFLALLKDFDIEYLIDVRSRPYSKFNSQFNQNEIKFFLERNGIKYIFMGDTIGGRPTDISCYDIEGKVDYEVIKTKDLFLKGIERLKTAYNKDINVVLMCSESKPCECHRSKLIGEELLKKNISIIHIISRNTTKTQETVINELTKGQGTVDIFGESLDFTSRKSYK